MTPRQTTAIFQQNDVIEERGGFVNMTSTKYVWSRTFLILFPPICYKGDWIILHDINGFYSV